MTTEPSRLNAMDALLAWSSGAVCRVVKTLRSAMGADMICLSSLVGKFERIPADPHTSQETSAIGFASTAEAIDALWVSNKNYFVMAVGLLKLTACKGVPSRC